MGEEKAPLVFRKEWVEQVKKIFVDKKSLGNADKIPRVAAPLLDAKPEAYIPHFVSLGPYHHWTLEKNIAASASAGDSYEFRELKMSTVEAYKVQSAATFWGNSSESLDAIVEKIKGMQQQIEDFYDWKISRDGEYAEHFALMMAIDASFLLRFLSSNSGSSDADMKCLSRIEVSIKCDILKLENQIPLFVLFVLRETLNSAGHQALYPTVQDFSKLWQNKYSTELSPFNQFDRTNNDDGQPHLLGCLHAFVSPLLLMEVIDGPERTLIQRMKHSLEVVVEVVVAAIFTIFRVRHPSNEGRHDILKSYNAGELEKGGIKFKSFSMRSDHIRFDKYSGTLYLPRITVSEMQTEVFLRNMLAFEFNDADRGDRVTRFVGLMDCLIDTAEDVRLLRESQVLLRGSVMLNDESIADMWNGMCHPIFKGHLEPPKDVNHALKEVLIRKYYMSLVKKLLWEFYWDHLSKPGKGVALVVGVLILGMTIIQTYSTWKQWQHEKSPR